VGVGWVLKSAFYGRASLNKKVFLLPEPFLVTCLELSLACWNRLLAAFLAEAPMPARVRLRGSIEGSIWDRFLKYFRPKKLQKKLAFLTQNKAKFWKKLIITLVFEQNANFYAENCRKSQKIVSITSTPGNDFTKLYFGRKFFGQSFTLEFRTKFYP
jgi:hypothetical protein